MTKYVLGFLIDSDGYVCLIEKNRPEWQKGKLNGIGGHIEEGETPEQAMIREFKEETGADVQKWRKFGVMTDNKDNAEIHLFSAKWEDEKPKPLSVTDEHVNWYPIDRLPEHIIPNLRWLVPMANYPNPFIAEITFKSQLW